MLSYQRHIVFLLIILALHDWAETWSLAAHLACRGLTRCGPSLRIAPSGNAASDALRHRGGRRAWEISQLSSSHDQAAGVFISSGPSLKYVVYFLNEILHSPSFRVQVSRYPPQVLHSLPV
ncbi:hypothetical protein D9M71_710990 [compost metagenome]